MDWTSNSRMNNEPLVYGFGLATRGSLNEHDGGDE